MIRTVIFDIGNVLVHFSYEKMFDQVTQVCGINHANVMMKMQDCGIIYEEGNISTDSFYSQFCLNASKTFSKEAFCTAISDIFVANPSIYPVVDAIKEQGLRLILLSNTCEAHYEYLTQTFPIFQKFDHAVLSHHVHSRKPHKEIYEAALKVAECAPEECFYTDDIVQYVEAARLQGIHAEVYTDTPTLVKHLQQHKILLMS